MTTQELDNLIDILNSDDVTTVEFGEALFNNLQKKDKANIYRILTKQVSPEWIQWSKSFTSKQHDMCYRRNMQRTDEHKIGFNVTLVVK